MVTEGNSAREALRQGQAARERAQNHLERVRAALGRARNMLEGVVRQAEEEDAAELQRREAMADKLLHVIRSGGPGDFSRDDKASDRHEVVSAAGKVRRAAAERAIAELQREESEAERLVDRIVEDIALSIRRVMAEEADKLAGKWVELDDQARALRSQLGDRYSPLLRLDIGDKVMEANAANEREARNMNDREIGSAAASIWENLAADLVHDSEARPGFMSIDRLRAKAREKAERDKSELEALLAKGPPVVSTPDPSWFDRMALRGAAQ